MTKPELVGQEPLKLVGDETCPWCGHGIATELELKEGVEAGCKVCQETLDALDKSREEALGTISQDMSLGQEFLSLGPDRHSSR